MPRYMVMPWPRMPRGKTAKAFSSRDTVKVNRSVFVRIPRMTNESEHFACKADGAAFTVLSAALRVTARYNSEAERLVEARPDVPRVTCIVAPPSSPPS